MKNLRTVLIGVVAGLFMWNVFLGLNNLQNQTTILGLRLNNKPLSFLGKSQIEQVIQREVGQTRTNLKFAYQGHIFEFKKVDVGAKVDVSTLTTKLLSVGRTDSFGDRLKVQIRSSLGLQKEKISGEISQSLLTLKLVDIQNQVNQDALPIRPDFTKDLNTTLPAEDGIKVDTNKLTILVADNIFAPPALPLPLPTMKIFTTHPEEELAPIRKKVPHLIKQPLSISSGGLVFTLTPGDLQNLLTVVERPDSKNPGKLILQLRLDDKKLNQKLGEFAQKVEDVTHAEFDEEDSRVAIYSQFYSGKRRLVDIPIGSNLQNKAVLGTESGGPKVVYLTFDDGPNSIYHPMVLDILKAYNVKATFFLVGKNAQTDPDVAKRTFAEGNKIGNHSLTHSFLPKLTSASILKELQTTNDILKPFNNSADITFFRPPYGGVNLAVKQNAEALHLKMFLWDVDPRDWSEPSTEELVRRVVTATYPGADILLHSNHLSTVKALPKIIEALRGQGYSFEQLQ